MFELDVKVKCLSDVNYEFSPGEEPIYYTKNGDGYPGSPPELMDATGGDMVAYIGDDELMRFWVSNEDDLWDDMTYNESLYGTYYPDEWAEYVEGGLTTFCEMIDMGEEDFSSYKDFKKKFEEYLFKNEHYFDDWDIVDSQWSDKEDLIPYKWFVLKYPNAFKSI